MVLDQISNKTYDSETRIIPGYSNASELLILLLSPGPPHVLVFRFFFLFYSLFFVLDTFLTS